MLQIKIKKLEAVLGGLAPIAKENHRDGTLQMPDFSLPIEYSLEGRLLEFITVGKPVRVLRTKRNDVEALGNFVTSPVIEHDPVLGIFKTLNSVYQYTIYDRHN